MRDHVGVRGRSPDDLFALCHPACNLRGDKTVLVDGKIHDIEPLAYNFLRNFAKDNDLQVEVLPDDYFF